MQRGTGSSADPRGGTATEAAGREAHFSGAAHLHHVDDHREEIDPPLGGDSIRLRLELRSHRQWQRATRVEPQQHMLTKDDCGDG